MNGAQQKLIGETTDTKMNLRDDWSSIHFRRTATTRAHLNDALTRLLICFFSRRAVRLSLTFALDFHKRFDFKQI